MSLKIWLPMNRDLRNQGLLNNTITNSGATYSSDGKLGGCYTFDGVNDSLMVGNLSTMVETDFSFACWFYKDEWGTKGYETIFGGSSGFELESKVSSTNSPVLKLYNWGGGSCTYELSKWNHIIFTRNTTETKLYLNGELKATGTAGTIPNHDYFVGSWNTASQQNFKGKMCDVRIYDHCLSEMEIKQLSQGLVLHYPLNSNSTYTSLINKTTATYTIYNNHGVAASLIKQSESYLGAPVYRLSMTPTSDTLYSFRNGLHSHGVYGWRQTFAASTKYVFWIHYRPVTHMDVRVGGTASNISGWTEIPPEYVGNGWYRVGQYRDGTVTEAKTDNIFTSFYSPTAEAGVPIEIDFACPTLVQGLTEIQPSINWDMGNIIYDTSGYCNNGTINGLLSNSSDTSKYKASTYMPKAALITHPRPVFGGIDQEWTCAMWVKLDTVNQSGIAMNNFNVGNNIVHSANGMPLLYANSGSNDYYNYGNKAVTAGVWTHVVFVFRNSDVTKLIYINGIEQTNKNGPNRTSTPSGIQDIVTVGYNLAGYISDYRVYATALSPTDVKSLYQNCATIDPDGTIRGQIRS